MKGQRTSNRFIQLQQTALPACVYRPNEHVEYWLIWLRSTIIEGSMHSIGTWIPLSACMTDI